jgi:DNA modification methylase
MNYTILQGDNRTTLKTLADNSVDAIITDPPYGIDFLGKSWDANTGALETYQECLRVLKPGGHILAFSAARTYHHLAITLEQAGFEIRDQIMWIYSSGFPKSQDIGKQIERTEKKRADNALGIKRSKIESGPKTNCPKCNKTLNGSNQINCAEQSCDLREALKPADNAWAGWGTCLKPAHEPIALARKPIKTSIRENVLKYGTGAYNIDATRVPYEDAKDIETYLNNKKGPMERSTAQDGDGIGMFGGEVGYKAIKREVSAEEDLPEAGRFPSNVVGEIEGYQKYFYCPKVSRKERHIGHDDPGAQTRRARDEDGNTLPYAEKVDGASPTMLAEQFQLGIKTHWQMAEEMGGSLVDHEGNPTRSGNKALIPGIGDIYTHSLSKKYEDWCKQNNKSMPNVGNNHPTVKPIELMKYLIKLVTPPGGTVLDPFNGSGSTGCAAVELGHTYIGCELDPAYVEIAKKRIEAWYEHTRDPAKELFE